MGAFNPDRAGDRLARRKRKRIAQTALFVVLLTLAGAMLDPYILPPMGPTATRPERINARFTRCGERRSFACVVDGDTIRLGQRRVRLIGIDAPEVAGAQCAAERALGERAADRLLALVNDGEFDLVGHRFLNHDRHGRELRLARRGGESLGARLTGEGLARRSLRGRIGWC